MTPGENAQTRRFLDLAMRADRMEAPEWTTSAAVTEFGGFMFLDLTRMYSRT